jgi:hypothetical protein
VASVPGITPLLCLQVYRLRQRLLVCTAGLDYVLRSDDASLATPLPTFRKIFVFVFLYVLALKYDGTVFLRNV